ncbi:MAG: hypothetical protein V3S89_03240 [Desulfobacterales bacterium]
MANTDNSRKKLEFGGPEWCRSAAALGVRLMEESDLDLSIYSWGFSEEYVNTPERLMGGRSKAGYHFMIHNGKVSGGASLPDECLALPGFHVAVPWAMIAHSSYFPFNREGWRERGAAHQALREDLTAAGIDPNWRELYRKKGEKGAPLCTTCGSSDHDRQDCPVWPSGIGEVLAANTGKEAKWLQRSPELEGLPETEWGVPVFTEMTDEQKACFIGLLGG